MAHLADLTSPITFYVEELLLLQMPYRSLNLDHYVFFVGFYLTDGLLDGLLNCLVDY